MHSIGVIGCGAWATTASKILGENGHDVTIWCHREAYRSDIKNFQENKLALPGVRLPSSVRASTDASIFSEFGSWVICLPSKHIDTLKEFIPHFKNQRIISLIKGLNGQTKLASDHLKHLFGLDNIAVLSGPNLASELSRKLPGASVVASELIELAVHFQQLFSGPYFRVYTSADRLGVELGGVLKNVYAIAAGVVDGLSLGTNAKSALMTRSLNELVRIGVFLGAKDSTFFGLSGIGDLMATSYSRDSRNWQFGYNLSRQSTTNRDDRGIAEGGRTAMLLKDRLSKLDTPIFNGIADIIGGTPAHSVVASIMQRDLKSE